METMNQQLFSPPLEARVLALQKSLEQKDNHHTCEQEPFKSYCDKELCMSMVGIGDIGSDIEVQNLMIIKVNQFVFSCSNRTTCQLNTDALDQTLFQHVHVWNKLGDCASAPTGPKTWLSPLG